MKMSEYQFFFNVATAIASVTFGWVLNTIWGSLKDLQTADDKALIDKLAAIEGACCRTLCNAR